jgi:hypothetical protein
LVVADAGKAVLTTIATKNAAFALVDIFISELIFRLPVISDFTAELKRRSPRQSVR